MIALLAGVGAASIAVVLPYGSPEATARTTVYLREGENGERWRMNGEGPAWVEFQGGVHGLRFVVGENFEVEYVNRLQEPTIIHAHGLTPPQGLDGVPYVDAPPIEPGRSVVYK